MSLGKVLIFGDSYSTFEGFIPEGHEAYYDTKESGGTDVKDVKDTWWNKLITETDSELVLNNSWSGSIIGYTGYENTVCSKFSPFIYRLENSMKTIFPQKTRLTPFAVDFRQPLFFFYDRLLPAIFVFGICRKE